MNGINNYNSDDFEIFIFVRYDQIFEFELFQNIKIIPVKLKNEYARIFWQNFVLPFRSFEFDLFFFPASFAPLLFWKNYILVVHDLSFLKFKRNFSLLRLIYRYIFQCFSIRKASKVISISNLTRKEILHNYDIDSEVVYNLVSKPKVIHSKAALFDNLGVKISYNDKIVVIPSSLALHKNISECVLACDVFSQNVHDVKFLFCGNWDILNFPYHFNSKNIFLLGYLPDDIKNSLLEYCDLILFPSVYEGFGIPYIESLLFLKPIVCSNIEIANEFLEGNSFFINSPYDHSEIINSLYKWHIAYPNYIINTNILNSLSENTIISNYCKILSNI